MKLKLDEQGKVVVQNGMPVYTYDDGKDAPFDALAARNKISELNAESQGHRVKKEELEARVKAFDGIEDPVAAKKALDTVKNLKDGDLVTAGKAEEIKAAAIRAATEQVEAAQRAAGEQIGTLTKQLETTTSQLNDNIIGGGFARSKMYTDPNAPMRLAIPPDIAQAAFGRNFKVEEGRAVGYDNKGNKIYSRARPGEIADMDEALEIIVDSHPNKNQLLLGSGAGGGGANPGNTSGGKRVITRAAFDSLGPVERSAAMKDVSSGVATMAD